MNGDLDPRLEAAGKVLAALSRGRELLSEPSIHNVGLATASFASAAEKLRALAGLLAESPQCGDESRDFVAELKQHRQAISSLLDQSAAWHANLFQEMSAASQIEGASSTAATRLHIEA